jgi:serine/threonine protein kinase
MNRLGASISRCPFCTEPIPFDAPGGLCPWCLCASVLDSQPGSAEQPKSIGGHRIRGVLGKGTFGVVYLAHHAQLRRDVALKISKQAYADPTQLAQFRQEVELLAELDLPNVVRIFDSGIADGHLYFTMPVMSGGTLRTRMSEHRDPWKAADLMAKIARAVHALHTHPLRVLHLDLKPENILFDQQGTPHISDFGLAKVAGESGWARSGLGIGCPAYVAPEQAFADQGVLTAATDVYSLGAILYELLTGVPPHTGKTLDQVFRRIALEEPVPPRQLVPELSRNLETVCLHALSTADARYASAAEFADDLENAAAHRSIVARRPSRIERTLHWVRRHPAASGALLLTALLGVWVFVLMRSFSRAESERIERAVNTNAFTASAQAGAALFQVTSYASQVRRAARDPSIFSLVENNRSVNPEPPELERYAEGFDSLLVMDTLGRPRAHWRGRPWEDGARTLALRDHFVKARYLAAHCPSQAYLARAFRSERSGKLQLGISAPLMDATGSWGGVLLAVVQAQVAFAKVALEDPARGHLTSLLGPRDNELNQQAPPPDFAVLVHEGLADGMEHALREPSPGELHERFGAADDACVQLESRKVPPLTLLDYRDPVPGFGGPWLATIAPIGQTGFMVIVQTNHPDVDDDANVNDDPTSPRPVPSMAFRP